MKLKKGSKAARDYMARIRALRGTNPAKSRRRKMSPSQSREFFDRLPSKDFSYHGYFVRYRELDQLFYISRDGFHVATANSAENAKRTIDQISDNPVKKKSKITGKSPSARLRKRRAKKPIKGYFPNATAVPVVKRHFAARSRDPYTTLQMGEEVRIKSSGEVYTVRAVGGGLQIYGKSISTKRVMYAGDRNAILLNQTFSIGFYDNLNDENKAKIPTYRSK